MPIEVMGAAVAGMIRLVFLPLDAGFDQSKQLSGVTRDDELFVRRHDPRFDGAASSRQTRRVTLIGAGIDFEAEPRTGFTDALAESRLSVHRFRQ